jgi:signal transduction histidine kinase
VYQKLNLPKPLIFLVLLLRAFLPVSAQPQLNFLVDSLKQVLPNATGKVRYEVTYKIAYELFDVDNPEALKFATLAYGYASDLGDSLEITRSGRIRGQLLRRVDQPDEAINQFLIVLPIAERNQQVAELKRILNALAISYNYKAMYDKALEYHFKSLEIREKEGNKKEIANALNNIGLVYYKIADFEQALSFYNRALEQRQQIDDKQGLDELLINLALCYTYLGDYKKSDEYVGKGFEICGDGCNDLVKLQGEYSLGVSSMLSKKYEQAIVHFEKSYSIAIKVEDKRFQSETVLNLARIALTYQDYDDCFKKLQESEAISEKAGYNQILINTYSTFSELYNKTKDFEKAALYQAKYIHLKDSIYSEGLIKNLTHVRSNYEERENIKTIREKNEVLRLKEEVISRQKTQYFFILTITILSIVLTFVFIRYNRSQHRANIELTKVKREIENKNQQLQINNAELDARVQKRTVELEQSNTALQRVNDELDNFIYKTSHDIRGPLASLKGMTNVAMLDVKDSVALEYFRKLDASADKLNTILTRLVIVNHINHVTLLPEKVNCTELIEDILILQRKKGLPDRFSITYQVEPEAELITDKSVLRLIIENLVDNGIKFHTESERVVPFVNIEVQFKRTDRVEIFITDNGIGIPKSDQPKLFHMFMRASERSETGGIGLYLAKLSTEKLGGQIYFEATPHGHTRFSIEIPSDLSKILHKQKLEAHQLEALADQSKKIV